MQMNDQDLFEKVVMPIYRQMYREATPSADFDELIKNGTAHKEGFFHDYHLSQDRQDEIIKKELKKHKLTKWQKRDIEISVTLGSSPCSCNGENKEHKVKK